MGSAPRRPPSLEVSRNDSHHGNEPANEAEVGEVVGVDGGGRVDLQAVIVLPGVFK